MLDPGVSHYHISMDRAVEVGHLQFGGDQVDAYRGEGRQPCTMGLKIFRAGGLHQRGVSGEVHDPGRVGVDVFDPGAESRAHRSARAPASTRSTISPIDVRSVFSGSTIRRVGWM